MISLADGARLMWAHEAVVKSLRDIWRDTPDGREMMIRMEKLGAAQQDFAELVSRLTERE